MKHAWLLYVEIVIYIRTKYVIYTNEDSMFITSYLLFLFQGDNFVLSAIFCAIEENNREGLDKLLSMANIDVNQTNKHGEGAIHVAAGLGQLDILKVLATKGGNLGLVDNRGDSAIYWAARQGHVDVIQHLVSQGVHVNMQNKVIQ